MILAKAKTKACVRRARFCRARQSGLVGVLGGTKTNSHDESSDWPIGQTDGSAAHLAGSCIPGEVTRGCSLVGSKRASNEFSSGEEESFGSESRVDSRRVLTCRQAHPRGFRNDGGMELSAWLL